MNWMPRISEFGVSEIFVSAVALSFGFIFYMTVRRVLNRIPVLFVSLGYAIAFVGSFLVGFPPKSLDVISLFGWVLILFGIVLAAKGKSIGVASALLFCVLCGLLVARYSGSAGAGDPMVRWLMEKFDFSLETAETLIHWMRKMLHFTFYGSFALAFGLALRAAGESLRLASIFGITWALLHAIFDEVRQLGSVGRSGSFWDILLDLTGALCFIGIWYFRCRSKVSTTGKL